MGDEDYSCRDDNKTKTDIENYGLSVIILEATDYLPSFAYSIGLWERYKHPEIICFGFSTKTLHGLINDVADLVKAGTAIETNTKYGNFLENSDIQFIQVDTLYLSNYFGYALNYYQTDFPALQLIWTDRNNKFPWDAGFEEEFIYKQPLLDRNTGFKFREARNLAIFTTKQWMNQNRPIVRVVHDVDGAWQFLTGDQTFSDICIVGLEQMTKRDSTLNEVFDLDFGEAASRNFIGDDWERGVAESEEDDNDAD